jgi:hypothetical protein
MATAKLKPSATARLLLAQYAPLPVRQSWWCRVLKLLRR